MNLLQALFSQEVEDTIFFEQTYPLTNDFLKSKDALAIVRSAIEPGELGHVKFHGVRWRACSSYSESIPVGTQVRVLGRRANILVVEPVEEQIFTPTYGEMLDAAVVTM